jgi:hypothetical protein
VQTRNNDVSNTTRSAAAPRRQAEVNRFATNSVANKAATRLKTETPYQNRANGSYRLPTNNRTAGSSNHINRSGQTNFGYNIVNAPTNTRGHRATTTPAVRHRYNAINTPAVNSKNELSATQRNAATRNKPVTAVNRDSKMGENTRSNLAPNTTGAVRHTGTANNSVAKTRNSIAATHEKTTEAAKKNHSNVTTRSNTAHATPATGAGSNTAHAKSAPAARHSTTRGTTRSSATSGQTATRNTSTRNTATSGRVYADQFKANRRFGYPLGDGYYSQKTRSGAWVSGVNSGRHTTRNNAVRGNNMMHGNRITRNYNTARTGANRAINRSTRGLQARDYNYGVRRLDNRANDFYNHGQVNRTFRGTRNAANHGYRNFYGMHPYSTNGFYGTHNPMMYGQSMLDNAIIAPNTMTIDNMYGNREVNRPLERSNRVRSNRMVQATDTSPGIERVTARSMDRDMTTQSLDNSNTQINNNDLSVNKNDLNVR